jgi:hypothetical protein
MAEGTALEPSQAQPLGCDYASTLSTSSTHADTPSRLFYRSQDLEPCDDIPERHRQSRAA